MENNENNSAGEDYTEEEEKQMKDLLKKIDVEEGVKKILEVGLENLEIVDNKNIDEIISSIEKNAYYKECLEGKEDMASKIIGEIIRN